ncbi:MAG TPA: hypothetical protein VF139_12820 [Candidatus Polarisedimenticolaceae bacterium]
MSRRQRLRGIASASLLAVATATSVAAAASSPYYDLISVGCGGVTDDGVGHIVWHPDVATVAPEESTRILKYFEGPDTAACLKAILERDPALTTEIRAQEGASERTFARLQRRIHEAWDDFDVAAALEEVAKSGARGPKTQALLDRCAAIRVPFDRGVAGLRAAIRPVQDDAIVVGRPLVVEFTLENRGAATIEACFGPSFEWTLWDGKQARGIAEPVDHPTCVQRFALPPGGKASRAYTARVPEFPAGPARLVGTVQVVDPTQCDEYGCDRASVRTQDGVNVEVQRPAPPQRGSK